MALSITIITPGTFPIPAAKTSSVENSIMHVAPYLASKMKVNVLGRKFEVNPASKTIGGVMYKNISCRQRDFIQKATEHCMKYPASMIQIENRPKYVLHVKKKLPEANVWLSLHSITFLQPHKIKAKELGNALRLADKIIVNSQFLKTYVLSLFPDLEEKVCVNYLGVDEQRFTPQSLHSKKRAKSIQKLGLKGKKMILYVGRLSPIKGPHRLIEAVHQLKKTYPHFVLFLVGGQILQTNQSSPYIVKLRRMARKSRNHIRFVPFTSYNEIAKWYQLADVAVVPSVGQEAFGLVNLEALSSGVPVIASDTGGIPEIIVHKKNGLLVPLNNHVTNLVKALKELLSNAPLAEELGGWGRKQIVERFTWKSTADRLYSLYKSELVQT
ncbi:glycosyltransferase family 4 protein [Bacillus horti]|uniref:Spore coat protein SA n=1 Tax=Caldalkalibacillus horti TaxID=77523 RepID=A0ABT9W4P1_9BACI|nr:glycosyltransferase family 4 protein [Bacillus horti]MDQ0168095.1 spore coat protein SA [Bacillus horti]